MDLQKIPGNRWEPENNQQQQNRVDAGNVKQKCWNHKAGQAASVKRECHMSSNL